MDKLRNLVDTFRGEPDDVRRAAAPSGNRDSTRSVGSGRRLPPPAGRPESLRSEAPRPSPYRPTSELELLEGYGICGRCQGRGVVVADEVRADPLQLRSCPRCGGSGRKP